MNFARFGASIVTTGRLGVAGLLFLGLIAGCESESEPGDDPQSTIEADRQEIISTLEETAGRWRYGDKAVLYEQEFEYLRVENTYDEYLEIDRIKRMESDTVVAFDVKAVRFFERDSALVTLDVVFVGPTADTTRKPQEWMMFYHQGNWIRPTLSGLQSQIRFEERVRLADSAAAAEEDETW